MPLFRLASLALLSRASAFIRTSTVAAGKDIAGISIEEAAKDLQAEHEDFGDLQLVGSCCGAFEGEAASVSTRVNMNEIYGTADTLWKYLEGESECKAVHKKDYGQKGDKQCSYVFAFENKNAPLNEYAANCVPASICAQDVVGMTKGKIATYGVVLQILQQNLGKLIYVGGGPSESCYEAMHKINTGSISDYVKTEPIFLFGSIKVGKELKVHVDNMDRLGVKASLGDCKQDDPNYGYLFIHENEYWSKKKGAVDLKEYAEFKDKKANDKAADALLKEAEDKLVRLKKEKERRLSDVVV